MRIIHPMRATTARSTRNAVSHGCRSGFSRDRMSDRLSDFRDFRSRLKLLQLAQCGVPLDEPLAGFFGAPVWLARTEPLAVLSTSAEPLVP